MMWSEVNHIAQRQKLRARPGIASAALVSEQNTAFQFNSGREVLRSQEHKETDAWQSTVGEVSRKHGITFKRPEEERDQRKTKSKEMVLQMLKKIRQGLLKDLATITGLCEAAWTMS